MTKSKYTILIHLFISTFLKKYSLQEIMNCKESLSECTQIETFNQNTYSFVSSQSICFSDDDNHNGIILIKKNNNFDEIDFLNKTENNLKKEKGINNILTQLKIKIKFIHLVSSPEYLTLISECNQIIIIDLTKNSNKFIFKIDFEVMSISFANNLLIIAGGKYKGYYCIVDFTKYPLFVSSKEPTPFGRLNFCKLIWNPNQSFGKLLLSGESKYTNT